MDLFDADPFAAEIYLGQLDHLTGSFAAAEVAGLWDLSQQASSYASEITALRVVFSEDVLVDQQALLVSGMRSAPEVIGFTYDEATFTATWEFGDALGADRFEFRLLDTVTDQDGNRLDGELAGLAPNASGDGFEGGDLVLQLDVLPGDLDGDGYVDSRDMSLLLNDMAAAPEEQLYDITLDGVVDAVDQAVIQAAFGTYLPGLGLGTEVEIAQLSDQTSDDVSELVVLRSGHDASVSILNPATGDVVSTWALDAMFTYGDLSTFVSPQGDAQILFSAENPTTSAVRIWVLNPQTGDMTSFNLGRNTALLDVAGAGDEVFLVTQTAGSDKARLS